VETDLSVDDMAKLASSLSDIQSHQIQTATLPGHSSTMHGGSYWIQDPFGAAIVFNRMLGTSLNASEEGSGLADDRANPDDAYAATTDIMDDTGRPNEAVTIALKYPGKAVATVAKLDALLSKAGYKVKYKYRASESDCTHEQLIENSIRADNDLAHKLRNDVPALRTWPTVLHLDKHAATDFTLVVSPSIANNL
jgi:hypothetical protein